MSIATYYAPVAHKSKSMNSSISSQQTTRDSIANQIILCFLRKKFFLNCFRNSPPNDLLCESGLPHHPRAKNPTPYPSFYRNFFDLIHLSTGRFGHPTFQKPFWKLPSKASIAWKSSNLFLQTSSSATSKKALTPKMGNAESRPSCAKKFNSNASISSKMNIQSPTIKMLSFAGM